MVVALVESLSKELPAFDPARLSGAIADTASPPVLHKFAFQWLQTPNDATKYYVVARVGVKYRHPLYVPIVGTILDGIDGSGDSSFTLTASEEMRVENPTNLGAPGATNYYC